MKQSWAPILDGKCQGCWDYTTMLAWGWTWFIFLWDSKALILKAIMLAGYVQHVKAEKEMKPSKPLRILKMVMQMQVVGL